MGASRVGSQTPQGKVEHDATLRSFAERLRIVRVTAGLSQYELDARCYMLHGEVSTLECGRRAPGLFTLLRLADELRVDPGVLLDGLPVPQHKASIEQALALVEANPGINTTRLAKAMKVSASYALRLLRRLASLGHVTNYEGGWISAGSVSELSTRQGSGTKRPQ